MTTTRLAEFTPTPGGKLLRRACVAHFAEIGRLLAEREACLRNPEISFRECAELEQQVAQQLSALEASGPRVRGNAAEWALIEGEEDRVQGAIFALLTLENGKSKALADAARNSDASSAGWWERALKHARSDVEEFTRQTLVPGGRMQRLVAARVSGYRWEGEPAALARRLNDADAADDAELRDALAIALARVAPSALRSCLGHLWNTGPLSPALCYASLLTRHADSRDRVRTVLSEGSTNDPRRLCELVALVGDPEDGSRLARSGERGLAWKVGALFGLGILGLPDYVDVLLDGLNDASAGVRAAAADSLERMTAAGLTRDRETRDLDPDADAEGERDGVASHVLTDRDAWAEWWAQHRPAYSMGVRYRRGAPFALASCLEEAKDFGAPTRWRALAIDELNLRGGTAVRLEADWFVDEQRRTLAA